LVTNQTRKGGEEMNKFYDWLEVEYLGTRAFLFFLIMVFVSVLLYLVLGKIFNYNFMWWMIVRPDFSNTLIISIKAFGEEAIFQLLPFLLYFKLFGKRHPALLIMILIVAAFHGYRHFGTVSLLSLTPIFILLSVAYLKLGGYQNNQLKAFVWLGTIHTTVNFTIHLISMGIVHWNIQWL